MRHLSPDGTSYRLEGQTQLPTVVLCHGVGLDLNAWNAQVDVLSHQFQILRYDMLGHGETPRQPNVRGIRDFSDQLFNLLAYLELESVSLIGHSMGGVIAQYFAFQHPTLLEKLVLMNTVYQRTPSELAGVHTRLALTENKGLSPIADAAIDRWFKPSFIENNPSTIAKIRHRLVSNDLDGYLDAYRIFASADDDIGDRLKQVTCPTLVIAGGLDPGSTPPIAHRMISDLPISAVIIFEQLGHLAPIEDPDQINMALLSFLTSSSSGV